MRPILVALALIVSGCIDDVELFHVCPKTCFTGSLEVLGVGTCRAGTPVCNDKGQVISCEGQVLPIYERCDTLDNDCDGEVDEDLVVGAGSVRNDCLQRGICRGTDEVCVDGVFVCDYPDGFPTEEICNAIDDDCNGYIDEELEETTADFCYTGPPGTALVGECLPGYPSCDRGQDGCTDTTPKQEICDGLDNDCDGIIDNVNIIYAGVDIVLGIDLSGSMSEVHEAVKRVVCDYAQSAQTLGGESTYRFAVLAIAEPDNSWTLTQNLVEADVLCTYMTGLRSGGGGTEPTISAANAVLDPSNPLNINWRQNSKRIFIGFADEFAATARAECPPDAPDICMAAALNQAAEFCLESSTDVYWFVRDSRDYLTQAQSCGGEVFWLSTDHYFMLDNMNSILGSVCLDGDSTAIVR